MKQTLDELAALTADVRAALDDARLRGVRAELRGAPLPEAIQPSAPDEVEPDTEDAGWSELARQAREASPTGATVLARVRDDLGDCRRCALSTGRTNLVFGVGDPDADLVICGEAPGYHEDIQGEPFVGPAGEMLDRMLVHVLGLQREQVYILNVIKCRPPRNRNPLPAEFESCLPFLERQIDAIQPRLILLLGSVALRSIFGPSVGGIKRNRGTWLAYRDVPVMPTFHPAYLLRQPADKRLTFEDLKATRARYDALGGRR